MTETTTSLTADVVESYPRYWHTDPSQRHHPGGETLTDDVAYVTSAGLMTSVKALAGFTERFTALDSAPDGFDPAHP